ncbi:MAG: tRNA-dihydrouridine synthase [Deltaproteobacteria bacterium]|nr:tRNA-dihydrouridine synthase [Deltaproteobacteria bacterium]
MIKTPALAKQIVRTVKLAVEDWKNGKSLEDLKIKEKLIKRIRAMNFKRIGKESVERSAALPVSVKTRLGYDSIVVEDWMKHLLEVEPVAISLHGRTLKQMYTGKADWEAIGRAAQVVHQTSTLILGNGDLTEPAQIVKRIQESKVDGVLLGRGALGNPWIFSYKEKIKAKVLAGEPWEEDQIWIGAEERFAVLMEHAKAFERIKGERSFSAMRKHFGWYCKAMPGAAELRKLMCQTSSSTEVAEVLKNYLTIHAQKTAA